MITLIITFHLFPLKFGCAKISTEVQYIAIVFIQGAKFRVYLSYNEVMYHKNASKEWDTRNELT